MVSSRVLADEDPAGEGEAIPTAPVGGETPPTIPHPTGHQLRRGILCSGRLLQIEKYKLNVYDPSSMCTLTFQCAL